MITGCCTRAAPCSGFSPGLPGLAEEETLPARRVLRDYGNMSAPTVLFVLQEILMAGAAGRFFCLAFGPGFTAAFLLLESNGHWPLSRSCLARPR